MPTASPCISMAPSYPPQNGPQSGAAPQFTVCRATDPGRAEIEAFIRDVYARRFGAQVRHFMPVLACLRDATGIVAAAGYRDARQSPLFLERYLHAPVEALLASRPGCRADAGNHRGGRSPGGRARRRRPPPDPAAGAAPGAAGLRVGGRHADRGAAPPVPAHRRHAAGPGRRRPGRAGGRGRRIGAATTSTGPMVLAGHLPQALRQLAARSSGMAR